MDKFYIFHIVVLPIVNMHVRSQIQFKILYHHHLLSQVSFPLVLLLLNQWCTPPLRLQASYCSTLLIMCGAPSTAVFWRECVVCFPVIVYRYCYNPLVTITVGQVITGMMKHFIFHIR
jgi:hypothetical protein